MARKKSEITSRKQRGRITIGIGLLLMATNLFGMDDVFLWAGVIFFALGCGDLFFDQRYRRKYKSR